MNDIIRLVLTLIGLAFITISCQPESVSTEFLEIDEKGVAMYRVTNPTNKDISGISFEFTYTNIDGKIINVDTVSYKIIFRSLA